MSRRPRYDVAIHAPFASPLYVGGQGDASGGAELQMAELGRTLAERGMRVCHVLFEHEGLPTSRDGVDVVTQPADEFEDNLVWYSRSIVRALRAADAHVYVQRTAGFETGVVAAFARARGRRFVFSSSSTTDMLPKPPLPTWASRLSFRTGLRLADEVVVQTAEQHVQASATLGRPPRLIRSFCRSGAPEDGSREAFLWIGGLIDYKDPLAYVRLAEQVPEARFWMIGTSRGEAWQSLSDEVHEAARRLENFELLEPRSRARLTDLYRQAVAVVNTSHFEGFPNTFMEGWAAGAAALSLNVDPDGVIERHGLGVAAAGEEERLAEGARMLWSARGDSPHALATRRYLAEHHDPRLVGDQWAELVADLKKR